MKHRLVCAGLAVSALSGLPAAGVAGAVEPVLSGALAIDQLGAHLQVSLSSADPEGNLVFSPLSVGVALAMASAGAEGETLAQMNEVLGLTMDDPHTAMAALIEGIERRGSGSLSVANVLWSQDGMAVEPDFTSTLEESYDSELQTADFRADAAAARDAVNAWVADATGGRIPDLLAPDAVDDLTRFLLVNAVYLDAEWASPFLAESTWSDEFTTGTGSIVEADFMHQTLHAGYAEADGVQSVTLPYAEGYEMVVVLPAEGTLADFEQALVDHDGDLDAVIGEPVSAEVALSLPKWDIETVTSLAETLQGLGMTLPFSDGADFSGITVEEPLEISDVVHQADITVDEAGTEAAAATAVIIGAGAAPGEEPVAMDVDRPFFFAVRDAETGTVLFQGHVNDPS